MVSIFELWLPILLSAAGVFIASSIIHMMLQYHKNDNKQLPNEDQIRNDLNKYNIPPGDYVVPYARDNKERQTPEFTEKMKQGPVIFMTVFPKGEIKMGKSFFLWFLYCIVIGIFAAYISGRALGPDAHYLAVFRFAGATAFVGYSLALWQDIIWYNRNVSAVIKSTIDGLIYALITAGFFGWLWPSAVS
ncbi:MAG: hypothetical protein Kow0098_07970 [Ignavibacteriaceae bacterium]